VSSHLSALGGDDFCWSIVEIAQGLPTDGRVGVEQPVQNCHPPSLAARIQYRQAMHLPLFVVILAPILVLLMIWSFARNAIAMKRDLDQRFDRLRRRLETDATKAIEPLLRERPDKNGSS
jgi:hypothetical protein